MIDVSPRIQRITIRAWQYDFVPQHIPGRINVIADSLSRVTPLEFQDSNAEKDILAVNFLQYSSIEEKERDEMLQETSKDKELQSLKHYISTGWPLKRSQIPVSLHPYWNYRDELTVESVAFWVTNPCRITRKVKQTKMYVCTLEEFILVDLDTLLCKLEEICIGKCCSLYTIATIAEKG